MFFSSHYEGLGADSSVAKVIVSISIMLIAGFLMTRITKKLLLPNVTAYIVAGILIGPYVLDLIPKDIAAGTAFLPDIALAFIAFSTGEFFRVETLKKNGIGVAVITLFEAMLATVLVFILCAFVFRLPMSFSAVLAALAAATAPASTMMTIRQVHARGEFVDTLLQVVALDDIVSLVAYSVSISLAVSLSTGAGISLERTVLPFLLNILMMAIGGVFGVILTLSMKTRHSTDNRLIIAVMLIFTFCGVCAIVDISPLLGCMCMATVYINMTDDEKLFRQLNYFSPPIMLLFFVRSGLSFDLGALFDTADSIGGYPLIYVGVGYFLVRIVGKYAGAYAGCLVTSRDRKIRNYLGLALIPQAGVAIGLAELGSRTLGGSMGNALETIILASSVLYELIGPASAKASLYLSGSYSDDIDSIPVESNAADGSERPYVDMLIERIQKIQEELAADSVNPDEVAYEEEAQQYYENQVNEPEIKKKEKEGKKKKEKNKEGKLRIKKKRGKNPDTETEEKEAKDSKDSKETKEPKEETGER